ncbi:MAG: bifunctional hydroxymethylpyrimidine kinase/phosphomethylpyrimidine kinase [Alphaproteobacteria bacterium]
MTETTIPRVLIIAGSDSGGGAGIQADIKTCAAFGVYSATAITAVTAQNTLGVQRVEVLSAELVRAQIQSVMSDIGADVIKIGMLGSKEIIDVVAEEIADVEALVVLDPVMVSTSGSALLEPDAVEALKTKLIPLCDVITPNVPEAELLTGMKIEAMEDLSKAGEKLLEMGAYAALMKGGHLKGKTLVDVLVSEDGASMMTGPRIHSRHTHGTGCTLASAVAAGLAQDTPLEAAVMAARDFVFDAISTAPKLGNGHGPLNHGLNTGEEAEDEPSPDNPFAALKGMT